MNYEKSDFNLILKDIGESFSATKRTSFEERLDECATSFLQGFGAEKSDSPSVIIKRLKNIEKNANRLISLTKSPEGSSAVVRLRRRAKYYQEIRVTTQSLTSSDMPEENIRPSDFSNIDSAIKAIKDLELYARTALADERKKVQVDEKRHKGRVARQTFVNDLAGLWLDMFGVMPGASINPKTGDSGGPFIRFIMACYVPLHRGWPTLPELDEEKARYHYRKSSTAVLKRCGNSNMAKSDLKKT